MKMKRFLHVLLAAGLLALAVPRGASAESAPGILVFEAIDSYAAHGGGMVEIEGLLQGETKPQLFTFEMQAPERCDRLASLAISHPGRYFFNIEFQGQTCRLTRR
jgi:hypothetical protein